MMTCQYLINKVGLIIQQLHLFKHVAHLTSDSFVPLLYKGAYICRVHRLKGIDAELFRFEPVHRDGAWTRRDYECALVILRQQFSQPNTRLLSSVVWKLINTVDKHNRATIF